MELDRKPTKKEEILLDFLIKKSGISFPADLQENLLVKSMSDGNMGSLLIIPTQKENLESRLVNINIKT